MLELRSPMLAPKAIKDLSILRFPLLASTKMDGVRCLVMNGTLISRSGKECPNKRLIERMRPLIDLLTVNHLILDGEIWSPDLNFQQIYSIWAAHDKDVSDLKLWAFDMLTFREWEAQTSRHYEHRKPGAIIGLQHIYSVVEQATIHTTTEIESLYATRLAEGHEGLILRDPRGRYKWGRCTIREHNMFKMKAEDELDCVVVDFEEKYGVASEAIRERDELGRLRQIHRTGDRVARGTLGAIIVRDEFKREFRVGSGFTDGQRQAIWANRENLKGQWLKVKYAVCGEKDLPRHPIFVSWRDPK